MNNIYTINEYQVSDGQKLEVLVIGDPHFKVNNVPESKLLTTKLLQLAKKMQPTFIVCLGDLLHRHETIHVTPLMRAEELIAGLSEVAPTFLIIGNHDRPNNSNFLTNEHPFNALKRWSNVFIIDTVQTFTFDDKIFTFVPYVSPGRFLEALNTCPGWEKSQCIFAHQEFYGAQMGAIKSQNGDHWSQEYPLVISGHIHDYQTLASNLIYVGTPYQHAFGDKDDKTVSIFKFGPEIKETRIDLLLMKRIIVYLTPEKIYDYEPPLNKLVKIVVRGDEVDIKACMKSSHIQRLKEEGCTVTFKTLVSKAVVTKTKDEPKRYLERLYEKVENQALQKRWVDKLFITV